MTEGWEDCRLLGPGWKRREVFRKSGFTCGKTDTYYQSPTGEKFRSKIEMVKYLGSSVDLTLFDFKNGTLLAPEELQTRKRKRSEGNNQEPKIKMLKVPAPPDGVPVMVEDGTMILCCEGCKTWFSGVLFGKTKLIHWFCSDCKAERRAFVKEQNFYKSVGCGTCAPCQLTEDCTACTICLLRAQNPEFNPKVKCLKRRCCKIVKKKSNRPLKQDKNVTPKVKSKKLSLSKMNVKTPQVCIQPEINFSPEFGIQPHVRLQQLGQFNKSAVSAEQDAELVPKIKPKKKNYGCGICPPCSVTEDCGACWTCKKKRTEPMRMMKRQWKCANRRCLLKRQIHQTRHKKIKEKIQELQKKIFARKEQTDVTLEELTEISQEQAPWFQKETPFVPQTMGNSHFVLKEEPHFVQKKTIFVPTEKSHFVPNEKTDFVQMEKINFDQKEKNYVFPKKKNRFGSKDKKGFVTKKLTIKWKLPFERQGDTGSMLMAKLKKKQQLQSKLSEQKMALKRHLSIHRNNRKCGECEPCMQIVDCGRCDFCRDKPKFGGRNLKRQKCRWRQCLRYAMEKNIPAVLKDIKQERGEGMSSKRMNTMSEKKHLNRLDFCSLKVPFIKLERLEDTLQCKAVVTKSGSDQEYEANGFSSEQSFCSKSSVQIKQEVDTNGTCEEAMLASLVPKDHPLPSSIDEVLIESNLAEADESTPVGKLLIGYRVDVRMLDMKPFIKRETKPPPCRIFHSRRLKRICGECEACYRERDCGTCDFCRDKPKFGGRNLKHQKCRWRQCHLFPLGKRQIEYKFTETKVGIKRFNRIKWPAAKAPPRRKRRFQRTCNKCGPCMQKEDCAECDFCLDKPKFGGPNLKRQKCRSRQCEFFALPHLQNLINQKHLVLVRKKRPRVDHEDEWEWDRAKRRRKMKLLSARKKLHMLQNAAQQASQATHTPMRSQPQVVVKDEFKERYLNVEDHRIVFKDVFVLLKRLEDTTECPTLVKEERYLNTEDHENLKVAFVLLKRLDDYIEYKSLVKEAKKGCPFTLQIKEGSAEHVGILDQDGEFVQAPRNQPHPQSSKEDCMESALDDEVCVLEAKRGCPFTLQIKEGSTEHAGILDQDGEFVRAPRNQPHPQSSKEDGMESALDDEVCVLEGSTTFHFDLEDFLIKSEEEEEEAADGDSLPVITEIISIGGGLILSRPNCDGSMQGSSSAAVP
ncbi:methyl-CpG-binding domain protein 1 isoform X4 [Lissotriton helveticus]